MGQREDEKRGLHEGKVQGGGWERGRKNKTATSDAKRMIIRGQNDYSAVLQDAIVAIML